MSSRRRVWQHVFEDRSESQLSDAFESVDWVVERLRRDYGEDLYARPFEEGHPTGHDFFIQLKGTDDVDQYRLKTGDCLSYSVELSNLIQWYSYTLPVIFIIWDITHKIGYWTHIQPFIKSKQVINTTWLDNKSGAKEPIRKVQVPTNQIIVENNLDSLSQLIKTEWRKIEQGKNHFEILYQAKTDLVDETVNQELPPMIKHQLKITELQAVVSAKPNEAKGWLDLASVYYDINNMSDALRAIDKAWSLDTKDGNIRQVRACVLAEFARESGGPPSMLHEAISLFELVRSNSNDSLTDYNIGNCYSELDQFQEAIDYYDKALLAKPEAKQAAQIWTNRGNAVDKIGDNKDAVKSFKNAIELNPSLWNAHASWAALEVRQENFKEAHYHFRDAFHHNPDLLTNGDNIAYWFAYTLYQIGEFKESLTVISQFLTVRPLHEDGLLLKAHLLHKLRRADTNYTAQALSFFRNRLLDDSTDMLARSELNLIYLEQGLDDERRRLLEETALLDNPPPLALYEYAILLEDEDRIDEAMVYLEIAVKKDQSHPVVHAMARLKRKMAQYREAITYYEMAIQDVTDPLPILESMSDCYHCLNNYEDCVIVISKALLLGATGISWWNNLDFALKELGVEPNQYTDFLRGKLYSGEDTTDQEIKRKLTSFMNTAV